MVTIELQDANLKRILSAGGEAARVTRRGMVKSLQGPVKNRVYADSIKMAPLLFGGLTASGRHSKITDGFHIVYGVKYAAAQHERHPPKGQRSKSKYAYEGYSIGQPGAWNEPRKFVFGNAGVNPWRRKFVNYGRRTLRATHGYKAQATHHWLFGRSFSAWESNSIWAVNTITAAGAGAVTGWLRQQPGVGGIG